MDPPAHLDTTSFTYHRLQHATPEHLHLTSRRAFIGPIPEGWLKSHRKDWYRHHLHLNYSSRKASFSAGANTNRQKRLTGLEEGPSTAALFKPSFPQPEELEEDAVDEGSEDEEEATTREPPAISVPRADGVEDEDVRTSKKTRSGKLLGDTDDVVDEAVPLNPEEQEDGGDHDGEERDEGVADVTNRQNNMLRPPDTRRTKDGQKENVGCLTNGARAGTENDDANDLRISQTSSRGESSQAGADMGGDTSTTSLLERDAKPIEEDRDKTAPTVNEPPPKSILHKVKQSVSRTTGDEPADDSVDATFSGRRKSRIHFELPEDVSQAAVLAKARMTQLDLKRPLKSALRRRTGLDGQIIKMEKMLVRLDTTKEKKLPDDYDENSSQGIITQTVEKWREFMVVCRQGREDEDEDFVLQIYKTRVIPALEKKGSRKATREVPLDRKAAKVNLYSSLDKSVVIWTPGRHGSQIIILRPGTTQSGVEWFTFLRNILGWHRSEQLIVNVPDMSVSLRIDNPFKSLEAKDDEDDDDDEETVAKKAMAKEQAVAQEIIDRCLEQLKISPEWQDVIGTWSSHQRIGLAWKRYDRLEWIYGANERKMYGTIALSKHMELELRAKEHYPTQSKTKKGKDLTEPPAVEGFLVRLTSKQGVHQRMGKLFFKRLYFHTHDQFLVFSRPANSDPPPPPKMPATTSADIPSSQQISDEIPLIYAVNPYPVEEGEVAWLREGHSGTSEARRHHDEDALDEYKRKIQNVSQCDGFINLCNVRKVRNVKLGADAADENIDSGSDVDFDMDVDDQHEDDGTTGEMDERRTFELVLSNGLVVRLQAFDEETKKEWKKRLRALVKYWKARHNGDVDILKSVRKQNLDELQIDEEMEAEIGQFAKKWEVTKSYASPTLYNMCGISCCRTVHMSGLLYFKPRLHKLFTAVQCVLIPGKVLMFEIMSRKRSGKAVPHIHHEKVAEIDLKECYLYSGLLTENDLLYQNRTFDSNNPGHSALPRMWLEDQWTSRDEDVMCCFVLWQPLNKGWFRSPSLREGGEGEEKERGTRLKRVTKLGATGRSSVFRARSRVERDRWVLALAAEVERVRGGEDVRITGG